MLIRSLTFRWKKWYWYLALFFNLSMPIFLAMNKLFLSSDTSDQLIFVSVVPAILLPFFFVYVFNTNKEFRACQAVIKVDRFRYFIRGIIISFVAFNLFWIILLLFYKNVLSESVKSILFWVFLVALCIMGTASGVFLTMFEFCVNFDIFYHQNKETIIKEYFLRNKSKFGPGRLR